MISMKKDYVFQSAYAEDFNRYLYERSLTLKQTTVRSERYYLEQLDRYLCAMAPEEQKLTGKILEKWLQRRPEEKKITQRTRLDFTRRLCGYLRKEDPSVEIPTLVIKCAQSDYTPYIFTHEELKRLFAAADRYKSTIRSPYLHLTVPVAFRILYGCGLRRGELVSLKTGDIDLENRYIYIREAKFGKPRYVPFTESLSEHLRKYMIQRFVHVEEWMYLFASRDDNIPYTSQAVYGWLRNLLFAAGIPHGGKGYGPRVHDFRHTFAVHSMQRCFQEKGDPMLILPMLSSYLGHKDFRGTQYYLRLTAEIYPDILDALLKKHGTMIRGDEDEEEI